MKTLAGSHPGHRPRARLDIYAFARSQRMHIVCPGMPLAALWWGWATTDRPSQANWCVALAHMAGSDIQHDEWPRRSRGRSSCCMSRYLPEQPSRRCISVAAAGPQQQQQQGRRRSSSSSSSSEAVVQKQSTKRSLTVPVSKRYVTTHTLFAGTMIS